MLCNFAFGLILILPRINISASRPAVIFTMHRHNKKKPNGVVLRHLDYALVVMTNDHVFLDGASFLAKCVYSRTNASKTRGRLGSTVFILEFW